MSPSSESTSRPGLWIVFVFTLLAGCGTTNPHGYFENDGPPRVGGSFEPAAVVPEHLPRSPWGNDPYTVFGHTYRPLASDCGYRARGIASWYGRKFNAARTSDHERYDMFAYSAANRTLPLPSFARVTDLANGRSVIVRVNDRGPFVANRLIDLSYAAARSLGMLGTGTAPVRVVAIDPSCGGRGAGTHVLQAGAFRSRARATRLADRLRIHGFNGVAVITTGAGGGLWYAVRIGPLIDEAIVATENRLASLGVPSLELPDH